MKNNRVEEKIDLILKQINKLSSKPTVDEWMNIEEACKFLRISRRTCQKLRDKHLLPYSKINRKILFRRKDLEMILEEHYVRVRSMLPRNKGSPG